MFMEPGGNVIRHSWMDNLDESLGHMTLHEWQIHQLPRATLSSEIYSAASDDSLSPAVTGETHGANNALSSV